MRLTFLFAYTCFLASILPLLSPSLRFLYFAPFLILCIYRLPLTSALWWALACGCVVDLLSSNHRLGMNAINYCLTVFFLYRYQYHFFEDRPSTLPLMTAFFASLSALLLLGSDAAIGSPFSLSWDWVKSDLILMSFWDGMYALLFFSLPPMILKLTSIRSALNRLQRMFK